MYVGGSISRLADGVGDARGVSGACDLDSNRQRSPAEEQLGGDVGIHEERHAQDQRRLDPRHAAQGAGVETQQLDEDLAIGDRQTRVAPGAGDRGRPLYDGSDAGPVAIGQGPTIGSGSQRSVQQAPLTALDHGFGAVAHAEGLKEEGYVLFHGVFRKAQFPRD